MDRNRVADSLTPDQVRALAGCFRLLDCRGSRQPLDEPLKPLNGIELTETQMRVQFRDVLDELRLDHAMGMRAQA